MNYVLKKKSTKYGLIFINCIAVLFLFSACNSNKNDTKNNTVSIKKDKVEVVKNINPKFEEVRQQKPTFKWKEDSDLYSESC